MMFVIQICKLTLVLPNSWNGTNLLCLASFFIREVNSSMECYSLYNFDKNSIWQVMLAKLVMVLEQYSL